MRLLDSSRCRFTEASKVLRSFLYYSLLYLPSRDRDMLSSGLSLGMG